MWLIQGLVWAVVVVLVVWVGGSKDKGIETTHVFSRTVVVVEGEMVEEVEDITAQQLPVLATLTLRTNQRNLNIHLLRFHLISLPTEATDQVKV